MKAEIYDLTGLNILNLELSPFLSNREEDSEESEEETKNEGKPETSQSESASGDDFPKAR